MVKTFFLLYQDTGNEEILKNIQITKDFLYGVKETKVDGNLILEADTDTPFTFYANDYNECMEECKAL